MRSGVIAQKVGMTRVFTETGEHIPVTVLKLGNCQVLGSPHQRKERLRRAAARFGLRARPSICPRRSAASSPSRFKVEPKRKLTLNFASRKTR